MRLAICTFLMLLSVLSTAQSVFGKWTTVDDQTGEHKSTVEIYENNGEMFGKIVEITRESRRNSLCDQCKGEEKDKPILGLNIIKGLRAKNNNKYEDGTILDPENGKVYKAKIWIDPDQPDILNVRGYVAFFYRTQYWIRAE